jgi:hypothetical protein
MLMQPQSPNPNFDFMLKDQPKPKRSLMPNLSKPLKIGLAVTGGIILLIIISSLLSGRNNGASQPIIGALARGQEIVRVTALLQQPPLQLRDPQTQALSATVSSSLSSDQQQLVSYLAKNHTKVNTVQLAADVNKSTDASLQSASQNNNLDSAYITYLKSNLGTYQTDIQTAYKSAGSNGKALLQKSFDSVNTILSSPQLKT